MHQCSCLFLYDSMSISILEFFIYLYVSHMSLCIIWICLFWFPCACMNRDGAAQVLQANVEFFKFVCPVRASDSILRRTAQVATVHISMYIYIYIWSIYYYIRYVLYVLFHGLCFLVFAHFLCMGEMPGLWYFHMSQTHTRAYSPHVPPAEQDITKFPCWYMRLLTIPYNIDLPRWRLSNGDFIVSRCLRADASCKFLQCPISFTFLRNQWPGRSTKDAAGAEFRLDWSWRSRSSRLCRWDHSLICL